MRSSKLALNPALAPLMPITFSPYREIPFRRCDRSWPVDWTRPDDPPPMTLEGEGFDPGVARSLEDALCAELRRLGCQVTDYPPGGEGESLLRIACASGLVRTDLGIKPVCDIGLYRVGLRGVLVYGSTAVAYMIRNHLMDNCVVPPGDAEPLDLRERKEDPK